ncbi:hypothetical protein DM02DRAFT_532421 [Periconia macrospinosa]|uniref:Uncharacterized protein n=1 Tax=Periconia macrospinosa TaxID=97972 RepID=A0A2V1DKS7_9PLEO|nr:hypothetical protein DM02DRAFT_532421 [Periconia macrospinosa]
MSEPRRSTRARAREEAQPTPVEPAKDTPSKPSKSQSHQQPQPQSLKRKRSSVPAKDARTTPANEVETATEPVQQAPKQVLPIRVADGQPLPTLSEPQPLGLPAQEYQDIQHSGVLSASLQRSRAVWVSGVNFRLFHAHFTPPKKVADRSEEDKANIQRQKELGRNFPLVGEAQLAPAPDPVIHMLAQRAGHDAELKAVMKIVAAGQATKAQLEFFQGHINELTNILQKQKEAAAKSSPRVPPPNPSQSSKPPGQVSRPPPQTPQPLSHTPQSTPQTPQPHTTQAPQYSPRPPSQAAQPIPPQPYQTPMGSAPPPHLPYANPYNNHPNTPSPRQPYPHPQQQQAHMPRYMPAPHVEKPTTYRPLVFDFKEGNGDKFYFPTYSFMEWLPGTQGAKFSFLITKLKPKPESQDKAEKKEKPAKPEAAVKPPSTPAPKAEPPATPNTATPNPPQATNGTQIPGQPALAPTPAPPAKPVTPYVPPPRIEDYDERKDMKDVEFHQPVTFLILTSVPEVLQSLPRAIRPPDVVEKYMNDVFDTTRRAEETYLAFRLPKEGAADADDKIKSSDVTPAPDAGGTAGQPEKKKARKSLAA